MKFILVIGNTRIAEIPGLTVAGSTQELIKFTPVADAEFLFYPKPRSINGIPITPQGHPTPALITKAINRILKVPIWVVRAGTILEPKIPFIHVTDIPGRDITRESGVVDLEQIRERAKIFSENMKEIDDEIIIGESIPGGTTTAMAVLNAMGYEATTSSSSMNNPVELKRKVVEGSIKRLKSQFNQGDYPKVLIARELADPVLVFISEVINNYQGKVILAGGTQMLAAYALSDMPGDVTLWTTRYVVGDPTATFVQTARSLGIRYEYSEINLSKSKFNGIRDYEKGMVKEGVGAGGFLNLAQKLNLVEKDVLEVIDNEYRNLVEARSD